MPDDLRLSAKTCCVIDNGLFVELAVTLSRTFGRVLYQSSWRQAFPRSNQMLVGTGIDGVERINDFWPILDEIDIFVFPDVLHGALQQYLRKLGKPVWGSGLAERLEIERAQSKVWLRDVGLAVGPYKVIRGLDRLRTYLEQHDDQYVKGSQRGDFETFHATNYRTIEPRLDELEHSLGAQKYLVEFVAESPIRSRSEVGYDGWTVDGKFPKASLFGIEVKDAGYVGEVRPYAGVPRELAYVNSRLSTLFQALGYRGFWSSEVRIGEDGTPYLIDPCCRMPSPPGELYHILLDNLAEIIWHGAHGKMVDPVYRHKWGAELILKSSWAEENWQAVDVPDELGDHVKLHYRCDVNGRRYFIPQAIQIPEIGAVVAGGNTLDEAMNNVLAIAKQVEGYDIEPPNEDALRKAAEGMATIARAA